MERYNALHQRQPPNLRQAIRDAHAANTALFGAFVGLPSLDVAKIFAATDADWIGIDAEHTPFSATLLSEMIQTVRAYGRGKSIPIVRVPTHSHEWIAWTIDAGAGGVIIPHTETAEQVQASVNAAKFPPVGHRSYPPFALLPVDGQTDAPEGKTWFQVANEHVAIIPQIESIKGCENAEEILLNPEVDAIMIGRMDLTFDCGGSQEKAGALIKQVEALAKKHGKPLLTFMMSSEEVPERLSEGYHILCAAVDVFLMAFGTNKMIAEQKELAAKYQAEKANAAKVEGQST